MRIATLSTYKFCILDLIYKIIKCAENNSVHSNKVEVYATIVKFAFKVQAK